MSRKAKKKIGKLSDKLFFRVSVSSSCDGSTVGRPTHRASEIPTQVQISHKSVVSNTATSFLDVKSLVAMSLVSKAWYTRTCDEDIWQASATSDWYAPFHGKDEAMDVKNNAKYKGIPGTSTIHDSDISNDRSCNIGMARSVWVSCQNSRKQQANVLSETSLVS